MPMKSATNVVNSCTGSILTVPGPETAGIAMTSEKAFDVVIDLVTGITLLETPGRTEALDVMVAKLDGTIGGREVVSLAERNRLAMRGGEADVE